jgi:hypothetical protein
MKIISVLSAFLLLHASIIFAQKEKNEQRTEDVTKITFLEPGVAHEFAVGKTATFFLRGGLTTSVALDYDDNITGILIRPFVSTSLRAYYNFKKRELLGKNTAKNSANYFALLAIVATSPLNKGTDYDPVYNKALLNTGVVWGLQRNYPVGLSLDLNIGLGYVKAGSTMGVSPVGELNVGLWLGKRNKNK